MNTQPPEQLSESVATEFAEACELSNDIDPEFPITVRFATYQEIVIVLGAPLSQKPHCYVKIGNAKEGVWPSLNLATGIAVDNFIKYWRRVISLGDNKDRYLHTQRLRRLFEEVD